MASTATVATAAATTASSSIPRFLLPRYGPMWRHHLGAPARSAAAATSRTGAGRRQLSMSARRHASTSQSPPAGKGGAGGKPLVLEKPAKFNPPSHGSRLPRKGAGGPASRHYGGELSATEAAAQKVREYPGMMAPEGTWSHWFWNSRNLHLSITVGTLAGLALFTFAENIRRTSPYADMLPAAADWASHPLTSMRTTLEVLRLTEAQRSAEIAERRQRRVDDVVKRSRYRKAHGIEEGGILASWGSRSDAEEEEQQGEPALAGGAAAAAAAATDDSGGGETSTSSPAAAAEVETSEGKRKKFLGIF